MTRDEVVALLRRDNPTGRADDIAMYADCYLDYQEAVVNIRENGNIVLHPRTAAPIENPYIKVKSSAMASLRKILRLKNTTSLWE